jgi:hypothetical protein
MIYNSSDKKVEEEPTAEEVEDSDDDGALIGLCTDINEESMRETILSLLTLNGGKSLPFMM